MHYIWKADATSGPSVSTVACGSKEQSKDD